MRSLLIGIVIAVLSVAPAAAQQLAQVTVSAQLTIPQVLTMRSGEVTEGVGANGERTRRMTLYVTANRSWMLSATRKCVSTCERLHLRVMNGTQAATIAVERTTIAIMQGRSGTAIPVTIELSWDADSPPPDAAELEYLITAG